MAVTLYFHPLQAQAAVMVLLAEMVRQVVQAGLVLTALLAVQHLHPDKAAQAVFPQTSNMAVVVAVLVQLVQMELEALAATEELVQLLA
jgi:hypothetical protein